MNDISIRISDERALVAETLLANRAHVVVVDDHAFRLVVLLQFLYLER